MEDSEIVEMYWSRSEAAIGATAEKYSRYCRRVAYNILRDDRDAEECANDTYLRAWNAIPPARPARLSAFLGKITRNLALNRLERYRAEKRNFGQADAALAELEECVPDTAVMPERVAESEMITQALNRFLAALPPLHRGIFVRRYWYISSIAEIAGDYGLSVSNTKTILFRTRKRLKENFVKEGISL